MSTKILVMSDSHGDVQRVREIFGKHGDADIIFFLGDGAADMRVVDMHFPKPLAKVRGNCDMFFSEDIPLELFLDIDGFKFMLCHGHMYGVKNSTELYHSAAKQRGCDAALFGHTHRAVNERREGVYLFNPGSVLSTGTYGIIETSESGICFNILTVGDK